MVAILFVLILTLIFSALEVWALAWFFAGMTLLAIFIIWATGGFQKCPKCEHRLTEQVTSNSPDASHGSAVMHEQIHLQCWNPWCRKTTTIQGMMIEARED